MKKYLVLTLLVALVGCSVFHKQPQNLTPIPPLPPLPPPLPVAHQPVRKLALPTRSLVRTNTVASPLNAKLVIVPPPAVQLAWDQVIDPTVNGYNVYWGAASRTYTNAVGVAGVTNTSVWIGPLVYLSTYYFAATSTATNGLESDFSNEVSYTVPLPPTNVVYTIQPMASTSVNGPWTNAGPAIVLINPPAPQMFFKLSITRTNF